MSRNLPRLVSVTPDGSTLVAEVFGRVLSASIENLADELSAEYPDGFTAFHAREHGRNLLVREVWQLAPEGEQGEAGDCNVADWVPIKRCRDGGHRVMDLTRLVRWSKKLGRSYESWDAWTACGAWLERHRGLELVWGDYYGRLVWQYGSPAYGDLSDRLAIHLDVAYQPPSLGDPVIVERGDTEPVGLWRVLQSDGNGRITHIVPHLDYEAGDREAGSQHRLDRLDPPVQRILVLRPEIHQAMLDSAETSWMTFDDAARAMLEACREANVDAAAFVHYEA